MTPTLGQVIGIVADRAGVSQSDLTGREAVDQDLKIQGDDAEELIKLLVGTFGEWLREWPWHDYIDFNEPPASIGPRAWKWLGLTKPGRAFPGYTDKRLELGHIAAVIDRGEWFEP